MIIPHKLPLAGLVALALCSNAANAIPPIPETSGWSGHIGLGVSVGRSESNLLAGIGSVDLGDETVPSLYQSPDDEDIALPVLPFEAAYTWADNGTQLFLGSRRAAHFSFEVDTTLDIQAGVRQALGEVGVVGLAIVASTLPTDVWKDPYLEDRVRGDTERTNTGVAIEWSGIFGTPLSLEWTAMEIEIDDEESGRLGDLGLSPDQQRALRREGEAYRLALNYDWRINARHTLVPGIGYIDDDLDGAAMAQDGLLLQVEHQYDAGGWSLVSKLYLEDLESDEGNPIYGDANDIETLGGSITSYFEQPFGLRDWTASAGVSYYEGDSENDFYDDSLALFSVGMLYRF